MDFSRLHGHVECPACAVTLPEADSWAQIAHMESQHPEAIAERLEAAGFKLVNGRWIDMWASDDG